MISSRGHVVGVGDVPARTQPTARSEGGGHDTQEGDGVEGAQGHHRERMVEVGLGRDGERPCADEGVRVGVLADREHPVVDRGSSRRSAPRTGGGRGRSGATTCRRRPRRTGRGWPSASASPGARPGPRRRRRSRRRRGRGSSDRWPPRARCGGWRRRPGRRAAPPWPRSGRRAGRASGRRRSSSRRAAWPARWSVPASPLAASFSVPSPPSTATTSMPSAAAPRASRVAWPRRVVSATVTSWSAASALAMTTRPRAVTDEAEALTMSRTRTRPATVAERRRLDGPRRPAGAANLALSRLSVENDAHERRRLRQADPGPG